MLLSSDTFARYVLFSIHPVFDSPTSPIIDSRLMIAGTATLPHLAHYSNASHPISNRQQGTGKGRWHGGSRLIASWVGYVSFLLFVYFLALLTTVYLQTATTTILTHNRENNRARDTSNASYLVSIFTFITITNIFVHSEKQKKNLYMPTPWRSANNVTC